MNHSQLRKIIKEVFTTAEIDPVLLLRYLHEINKKTEELADMLKNGPDDYEEMAVYASTLANLSNEVHLRIKAHIKKPQ